MSKAAELANLIGNINAGGGGVNRNVVINGAMNVAQRGTSETGVGASSGYFTCDRWKITAANTAGRLTMTQDSSAPDGFANSIKLDCTTADTSIAAGELLILEQRIEGQNLQTFKKGTSSALPMTISFYVKGNASATYAVQLLDKDNDRTFAKTFSVTTDWSRVSLTFAGDTTGAFTDDNGESLRLNIWLHAGSTYSGGTQTTGWVAESGNLDNLAVGITSFFDSTDRTFFITGVQLEVGQNPTTFEHEPIGTTLEKCHRYFYQLQESAFSYVTTGHSRTNNSGFGFMIDFPVKMRSKPTITLNAIDTEPNPGTSYPVSLVATYSSTRQTGMYVTRDSGTWGTEYSLLMLLRDSSSYIRADSEL
tara:strand:+ start:381 stop:1472 length:1092 start_codon:yes stop_codon:yes gene_type:complete